MIIIKEPHSHKEDSGNVTIIEEVSQSWSEGSGSVFAPGLFGLRRFGPPDILDGTFRPLTFWTWTFNPLTFWTRTFRPLRFWTWTFRRLIFWTRKFRSRTFWTWMFRSRTFRTRSFRPLTFLVQDVSLPAFWTRTFCPLRFWTRMFRPPPPHFLDLDVSHQGRFDMGLLGLRRFAPGRFGLARFARPVNILDQDVSPSDNCFIIQNICFSWKFAFRRF